MIAVNYSSARNNLKSYCDLAYDDNETVMITRKYDKNVVILSLDQYNQMKKIIHNAQYLAKLDSAFTQLYSGKGQEHELIEA